LDGVAGTLQEGRGAFMSSLERHQIGIYFGAVLLGSAMGMARPELGPAFEPAIWPVVGALLYFTFLQVPLLRFRQALADVRFLAALLASNFLFVPVMVWLLLHLLPDLLPIRLGVALVLLTPCTDWVNTFTLLGQGDVHRTLAATPMLLAAQILLLPFYLWLLFDASLGGAVAARPFVHAFVGLVAVPLLLAWLTEWWGHRHRRVAAMIRLAGPLPVVLLALTVFVIAVSQIQPVIAHARQLAQVAAVFVLFVVCAAGIGWVTNRLFSLAPRAGRGIYFSVGTRNSFVVLPLALAFPAEWKLAVAVIVIQAFVEMLGMLAFIRIVPGWLAPDEPAGVH